MRLLIGTVKQFIYGGAIRQPTVTERSQRITDAHKVIVEETAALKSHVEAIEASVKLNLEDAAGALKRVIDLKAKAP